MFKNIRNLFLFGMLLVFVTSCDSYSRVLKSTDPQLKLDRAKEYYNKGNYYRALPLFEELIPVYRGRPELEDIYYFYSFSHYGQGDYLSAAHNFRNFASTFPSSPKAEEAMFMHAYSFYKMSPNPNLDQTHTLRAIDAFQLFANRYSGSERLSEANILIDEMRRKLEVKALNGAELYYDMGNFQAAAVAYENVLFQYPDTDQAERINFMILKSHYNYARRSVESRKEERYLKAVNAYNNFIDRYPTSRFMNEAREIFQSTQQALQNLRA